MFGFLKQKIADFGKKVKATAAKKEEEISNSEKLTEEVKESQKAEKKAIEVKAHEKKAKKQSEKEKTLIEKEKVLPKQEKPHIKEEKTHAQKIKEEEIKIREEEIENLEKKRIEKLEDADEKQPATKEQDKKKEETDSKAKKVGLFGRLFGAGKKKEEKITAKKEIEQKKPEEKQKKKTKEEIAAELEAKMFKEIEGELKDEGTDAGEEAISEAEEEIQEKETQKAVELLESEEKEEKRQEKQKQGFDKEKLILEKEKSTPKENITNRIAQTAEEKEIEEDVEDELIEEEEAEEKEEIAEDLSREKTRDIHIKTLEEEKRELKAHVGTGGKLKGFLFGGVEISEKDINDLLWELELSLIESDVEQDAASELVKQIKTRLVGKKVSPKNLDDYLKEQIKEILTEMMHTETINLLDEAAKKKKEGKPLVILMLGPNGAGKTTSIAKLVHYFKKHNLTSVVAAGDTFRAGAIDQIEEHAKRLGVRVIKQQYGADPAAVSFDAIKAAEAGKIDVVLIDSAGRQETNKNLMEELRKIERVAKPDIRLYVGEAYVGQTLLEQVAEFEEIIGIDGFILTKIDTDAKGGTAISLLYKMKKPIVFVGTGQGYDDFKEFTPEFVLERII